MGETEPGPVIKMYKEDEDVPLLMWLDELDQKNREKALSRIELLRDFGYELKRPIADTLRNGIHELRWKDSQHN
ncbi:MAG: type II toxin-antitoxin system RelE/ParE family toxin [bacterium]